MMEVPEKVFLQLNDPTCGPQLTWSHVKDITGDRTNIEYVRADKVINPNEILLARNLRLRELLELVYTHFQQMQSLAHPEPYKFPLWYDEIRRELEAVE